MFDEYSCFDVKFDGGVATVTMSRGDQLNTMVPEFWDELPALIGEIDAAGEARVGIFLAHRDILSLRK